MIHPVVKRTFAMCAAFAGLFSVSVSADVPQSFSIYSLEETVVFDRASLNCGNIGSNKKVTIGFEAPINGSIIAGTTVTIKDRASVDGDVTAGGAIVKGTNVTISGRQIPNTTVPTYTIPVLTVTPGTQYIDVGNDATRILAPGNYGAVVVRDRATLKLSAGTYQFRTLSLGNDVHLVLDFAASQSIDIKIANDFTISDRVTFDYPDNPDFSKVKIYSGTYNTVKLGYDMRFAAYLSVPRGKIEISDRVNFQGAIYGKYVYVKYDTKNELQIPTGEGIITVVKKVVDNGNGTYTVQFGYVNNGSKIVVVPVGINNYMTGLPGNNMDGGQVTTFYPGQVEIAFSVVTDFAGSSSIGWVLYGGDPDYTTNVDAGPGNVVNTNLPVLPTLQRVISNCDGTFKAFFGYTSLNDVIVRVNIGLDNFFTGTGSDSAGQPFLFKTGTHESAFEVTFSGSSITWTLQGNSITANASDALISCSPITPILTAVVENSDGTAKAVFGYSNPNQIIVSRTITATNNNITGFADSALGQPTQFDTGAVPEAFSVNFTEPQISWTLDGVTVTAVKTSATDRDFGMWASSYIGGVGGNYTLNGSRMTISVTGAAGTPTNDRLYFVNYQTTSNFEIKTKIAPTAAGTQKAGLMIRGSINDNAEYFALKVDSTGSIVREERNVAGTAYTSATVGSATVNPWIRIVKNGSIFDAYISADGSNWTSAGSQTIAMSSNVHAGLAMEGNGGSAVNREFKNVQVSFEDANTNQIPDVVEGIIGGSLTGVPTRSHWINEGLLKIVTDNYSSVSGYSHCTAVQTCYSQAEVDGAILPVDQLVDAVSAPVPVTPGLTIDGGKLHKITGSVKNFGRVLQAFPISAQFRGVPKELLRLDHYNTVTSQWEPVEIAQVTTNAAYAKVKSYSYYRLASGYAIRPTVTSGSELETQLQYVKDNALPAGTRYAILCLGATGAGIEYRPASATSFTAFTIPENVLLLGGLPDPVTVPPEKAFVADPKRFKSILTVNATSGTKQIVVNMSVNLSGGAEKHMYRTVDGFTIRGGNNLGSAWSAGGVRIAGIGGHVYDDTIRNCVIEENTGSNAGGIIVANAMQVDISNCIFQNNTQIVSNDATDAPKDGKKYGASAILLTLGGACHCETSVRNCVFFNNTAQGPLYSGTLTLFGDYDMAGTATSTPSSGTSTNFTDGYIYNCTFYGNRSATDQASCAGALVRKSSDYDRINVRNSIIRGNTPTGSSTRNVNENITKDHVKYCNIEDATIQPVTTGAPGPEFNFNQDPWFKGTTSPTLLKLKIGSVCRNTGIDLDIVKYDINGLERRKNHNDMGAYENYIQILPIGDGNTVGWNAYTYRAFLKKNMIANDWEVDFIGSSEIPPFDPAYGATWDNAYEMSTDAKEYLKNDVQHEGLFGRTISSLTGTSTAQADVNAKVADYLGSESLKDFDLMLLFVGTEDIITETAANVQSAIERLVTGIATYISNNGGNKKVVLSTVPPQKGEDGSALDNKIETLQQNILLSSLIKSQVDTIAEMYNPSFDLNNSSSIEPNEYLKVQAHFSDEDKRYFTERGYKIMAEEWWSCVKPLYP